MFYCALLSCKYNRCIFLRIILRKATMITLIIMLLCLQMYTCDGRYEANLVFLERRDLNSRMGYEKTGPAIDTALEKVSEMYKDTIKFNLVFKDIIECTPLYVGVFASEMVYRKNISAFIGPACSGAMNVFGYMAVTWNLPVVTPLGNSGVLADDIFNVITRFSGWTLIHFAEFADVIFQQFGYTYISMIYGNSGFRSNCGNTFQTHFRYKYGLNENGIWNHLPIDPEQLTDEEAEKLLISASQTSRVFILFLEQDTHLRRFMLIAHRLGMTNGDYFFMSAASSRGVTKSWWSRDDGMDIEAKEAFQNLFVITVLVNLTDSYYEFEREVKNRSLVQHGFDYQDEKPTILLAGYHDSVTVYAEVLNETLALGKDPTNGSEFSRRMWNRTFQGIAGELAIGPKGFRNGNLGLQQIDLEGNWRVVARFDVPGQKYLPSDTEKIFWRGNGPTKNIPRCGFRNDLCEEGVSSTLIYSLGITFGILVFGVLIVLPLLFRRWKKQVEAEKLWWRIDKGDLIQNAGVTGRSTLSLLSKVSQVHPNDTDVTWNMALYKGNPVRIRELQLYETFDPFSAKLIKEFSKVRDINCSNLNKVIGACIGNGPETLLITEFCSKGTLQDLLGNHSFSLDSQFKFSLSNDIAQGMLYLCDSSIGFHGNLTSSICLIDNRFSVKIADYGIPSLFNKVKIEYESQEYKTECLWKAPELLRSNSVKGSKEGDIYSFGIILFEILTREQPFADETAELGISAVIDKIKDNTPPYRRPEMKDSGKQSELESLIKLCWSEVPSARPHFSQVKKVLKEQASKYGEGTNLLDNLLRRMEQYANNLEKLVEEKTEELIEEKRRSEQLLYQILPKSVAESLKIGQPVQPEAFDSVTIYFSDIVGFTEISAKSSPLEVVNLLNDLYVCFDGIIEKLNVYKVETIGDAYMVVSGLPIRHPHHGKEIATMSLAIRKAISSFKIRHMHDHRLEIRIGLHTGPTIAGVVGLKMPRYCLFGDTVNTASRMESNGQAMKIHISSVTKSELESYECFDLIPRGEINIKGKGVMETYWLEQGD